VNRNSEVGNEIREAVVPMRIISLSFWIGEKIKRAWTSLMGPIWGFWKTVKGVGVVIAVPACKMSHSMTFGDRINARCLFLGGQIETFGLYRIACRSTDVHVLASTIALFSPNYHSLH
jgi:hypothetical protein